MSGYRNLAKANSVSKCRHSLSLYTAVQQQSLGEVVAFILETCADISDCNGEKVARISQQSPKTLQK